VARVKRWKGTLIHSPIEEKKGMQPSHRRDRQKAGPGICCPKTGAPKKEKKKERGKRESASVMGGPTGKKKKKRVSSF